MGNYSSTRLCEEDQDLYDEDTSEITISSGIVDVAIHRIIAHPFLVLRRQCQINAWSRKSHLLPFSLVPVVFRLIRKHKLDALLKGLHGVMILDFTTFVAEGLISVYGGLPNYALHHQDLPAQLSYYGLKFIGALLTGPMYAAAVQTTVQTLRGGNPFNAVDFLMTVASRYSVWQIPSSAHPLKRTMPVWIIAPLYAGFVTVRLFVGSELQWRLFIWMKHRRERATIALPDVTDHNVNEVKGNVYLTTSVCKFSTKGTFGNTFRRYESRAIALIITDILLYPLETILNRLCIQGTRAAIDNLDTGVDSVPTVFSYRNPIQCASQIVKMSGVSGFYKGLGAIGLQAIAFAFIFGAGHFLLNHFELENRKVSDKEQ